MVHLVTGYAGMEHITSADQGSFNASFFGRGQFVMEAGKQIEAEIIDNHTVRVLDGDILMHGRHIRIPPDNYEDMTITTGTAGKNRIDLICITYDKNTVDGTEKSYMEVIKGIETEGTPAVPEYIVGNVLDGAEKNQMPLYSVTISGVVLSGISRLFKTIPTYKTLAEIYEREFIQACQNYLGALGVIDTMDGIRANEKSDQLVGALALKQYDVAVTQMLQGKSPNDHTHDNRYYTETEVDNKLTEKAASSHKHSKSQITDFPSALPASDVHAWAKEKNKPGYNWDEIGGKPSTYTPSTHSHDDYYYTKPEINAKLLDLIKSGRYIIKTEYSSANAANARFAHRLDGKKIFATIAQIHDDSGIRSFPYYLTTSSSSSEVQVVAYSHSQWTPVNSTITVEVTIFYI